MAPDRKPTPPSVQSFLSRFAEQIERNPDIEKWQDSYRRLHPQASEEELKFLSYEISHQSYREEALALAEQMMSKDPPDLHGAERTRSSIRAWKTLASNPKWAGKVQSVAAQKIAELEELLEVQASKSNIERFAKVYGIPRPSDDDVIRDILNRFTKQQQRMPIKDVFGYGTLLKLKNDLLHAETTRSGRKAVKDALAAGTVPVYDDGNILVVAPKTHESSRHYGGGTSWCISTSNVGYWNEYFAQNTVFMLWNRGLGDDANMSRVAILKASPDDPGMIFDRKDNEVTDVELQHSIGNKDTYEAVMAAITDHTMDDTARRSRGLDALADETYDPTEYWHDFVLMVADSIPSGINKIEYATGTEFNYNEAKRYALEVFSKNGLSDDDVLTALAAVHRGWIESMDNPGEVEGGVGILNLRKPSGEGYWIWMVTGLRLLGVADDERIRKGFEKTANELMDYYDHVRESGETDDGNDF